VIMGRLIPAGTGMEFYRRVKIAGEDVVEEEAVPEQEVSFADGLGDYWDDTPGIYTGGLSEDLEAEQASVLPTKSKATNTQAQKVDRRLSGAAFFALPDSFLTEGGHRVDSGRSFCRQ
ncbi:MAG TPA: hypothetical protein VHZ55_26290, partial [Bryobacteraceae bacterium]|nr:hypothetical protein [Bryobacteraceae bacterium]